MNIRLMAIVSLLVLIVIVAGIILYIKLPRRLKVDRFIASWRELQGFCKDKATWPVAIIEADKLLDVALKKRKLKGKTMGGRLVAAQRMLSDNDNVWFAHNLAKKLIAKTDTKLKESDVKNALVGFRQALKDMGALPSSSPEQEKKQI